MTSPFMIPMQYRNLRYLPLTYRKMRLPLIGGCGVRIISKRRLREFWESRKKDSTLAQRTLLAWYKLAKKADWGSFAELKQTFGTADQVGNCVVFDVGNNRYRLIGRVSYRKRIVYVLRVMDHAEYDKNRWVDECGCRKPPPKHQNSPEQNGKR